MYTLCTAVSKYGCTLPLPPPPVGRGKGRCNIDKNLRGNLPQVIRKVRANGIFKHGIIPITYRSNNNRGTKLITTLVTVGLKNGKVYKLAIRSLALGIKYVTIPLSSHSVYVAQNKVTETIVNVITCNTHILPKITSPLYCTATLPCTASVYCALCTPAKTNDLQTKQPIGMGQRVYTEKVNNPVKGGRGGVYSVLCQSLTERVTLHTYYFFKLHVAWSMFADNELIAHYIACASIIFIVFSAELSNSLRWLLTNHYWHNLSLISILPSTFTTTSIGPAMGRKKFVTFSYNTSLRIYISVCDTMVVLAAANTFQFRSLTKSTKSTRQNTVNVLVPITVKSVERKMSSVSPPCDEETAGKYICRPLTISANFNTLSRFPIYLMSYISLCFCTAAAAMCLSYPMIFPRYLCLKLTLLARNGSIYYGE
jgi:hypothetical protein